MRARGLAVSVLFLSTRAVAGPAATATPVAAASPSPPPPGPAGGSRLDAAIYVYADDPQASQVGTRASDGLHRYAAAHGYKFAGDARLGELLDRAPDDLVRAAASLSTARAAMKEGQEEIARLHLDAAQDALLRANDAYLEAAAAPAYGEMRDVHLQLGVVALNSGQTDVALSQFRAVLFFSPGYQINRNAFPPSVVTAFEQARATINGRKGTLRVEADRTGAFFFLDGSLKGSIPRILTDVPEGTHYIEVRGPGAIPQFLPVQVAANDETAVSISVRTATSSVRKLWLEPGGEVGATAIARILGVDKVVIAAARTTITGVSPATVRGATFDETRRLTTAEVSSSRDAATTDKRIGKLAGELFRVNQGYAGVSNAALFVARERFMAPYETRISIETGGAFQDHFFDASGKSIPTNDPNYFQIDGNAPDHSFTSYYESRTILHARYGLRERTTVFVDIPFYAMQLIYDYDADGSSTIEPSEEKLKRQDEGMGDLVIGTDVRLRSLEGVLSLAWVTASAKLPTGNDNAAGFLRQYRHLVIGSGQSDLNAGFGVVMASGAFRTGLQASYTMRLADTLPYADPDPSVAVQRTTKPGDEQRVILDGAVHGGRWFAFEVAADYLHRNSMKGFFDPNTHTFGHTHDMSLVRGRGALRFEVTEHTDFGLVGEYPVYGRSTLTFFPLDVTGPRGYFYYGVRF